MSTAADLIKSSLRLIGVIASGETPSSSEQADCLEMLNDILEEWSNDGFMIFEKKHEDFTLTSGTSLYTFGTGGTFNSARPTTILEANLKVSGDTLELPLRIFNYQEWNKITLKSLASELPQGIYYNPAFPLGEVNVWPTPSAANKLTLTSLKPLTAIASAATTLSYPPGYKKALKYALASDAGPEFGKGVNPKIEATASSTRAAIQRTNTEPVYLTNDAYGLNERKFYNIMTGE